MFRVLLCLNFKKLENFNIYRFFYKHQLSPEKRVKTAQEKNPFRKAFFEIIIKSSGKEENSHYRLEGEQKSCVKFIVIYYSGTN